MILRRHGSDSASGSSIATVKTENNLDATHAMVPGGMESGCQGRSALIISGIQHERRIRKRARRHISIQHLEVLDLDTVQLQIQWGKFIYISNMTLLR